MTRLPLVAALLFVTPVAAAEPEAGAAKPQAAAPEAIRSSLEQRFPVQVLKLAPTEQDGRPAYVATVMVRPGDFNDAMRVERLLIDGESGALIRPQGSAGTEAAGTDYRTHQEGVENLGPARGRR